MDLTIIIVNWNGGELLRDCLASIAAHREGLDAQVIVVDNNSSDGSREMAEREFPQFTVINSGSNLGFGKANNLPRPRVKSDLVLFLNPDTVLLKSSLVSMVQYLRAHEEIGALGCKMRSPNGEVHELGLQYFLSPWTELANLTFVSKHTRRWLSKHSPLQDPQQSGYVTKLYGGCLLCRKGVLDAVGWFDERYFMYAEDVDLCRTILNRGWKLYYLSTAEIIHLAGGASKKAPSGFAILMKQESTVKFMRKYHGPTGALLYRLAAVVGSTFRLTALTVLRVLALVSSTARQRDFPAAFFKQRTLFLWSLGLQKPVIAS
jgi:hypothetical protein